jgi:hypothetical protein
MNRSSSASLTPLNTVEPQTQSPKLVMNKPLEDTQGFSPETLAWLDRGMEGMKRMNTDEAFRKEVESKLF